VNLKNEGRAGNTETVPAGVLGLNTEKSLKSQ